MPRYLEIKQEILEQIKTKEVNTSIPSERELSLLFDASRMTIRKAIDELVEEGVLYRDKNKGTFIADHTFVNRNSSKEILLEQDVDDLSLIHFNAKEYPEMAIRFNKPTHTLLLRVVCLNKKGGRPRCIEEFFFLYNKVENPHLTNIHELLDIKNVFDVGKMVQRFYPEIIPIKYANLLGLSLNMPVIMVETTLYDQRGELITIVKTYYNPKESPIEIVSNI